MADYATVVGFVQFEPNLREANGSEVRDITVKTPGQEGSLVRITLWDQFSDVEVELGDFVAVDGKVNVREVDGTTFVNMDANKLFVNGTVYRGGATPTGEREVVGRKSSTKRF